jgi:hypothetical protein
VLRVRKRGGHKFGNDVNTFRNAQNLPEIDFSEVKADITSVGDDRELKDVT